MRNFYIAVTVFLLAFYGQAYAAEFGHAWAVAPTRAVCVVSALVGFGNFIASVASSAGRRR